VVGPQWTAGGGGHGKGMTAEGWWAGWACVEADRLLWLRAGMKVPGRAWLQFQTAEHPSSALSTLTTFFAPRGLSGCLYWDGLIQCERWFSAGWIGPSVGAPSPSRSVTEKQRPAKTLAATVSQRADESLHPLQRFLQILHRRGIGQPQIAFAVLPEGRSGQQRHARLAQDPIRQ